MEIKGGRKLFFLVMLLIILIIPSVFARDFTIANTKDWKSLYLGTIYAGRTDSELLFFTSLKDSQIKTRMMGTKDNILILESRNQPIVKNYESLLKIDGYENYQTIYFDDYSELQATIFQNLKTKGLFIMNPEFGMIAVVAAPYIIEKDYIPFFINGENIDTARLLSKGKKTIAAGRIPDRYLDKINAEEILGTPDYTTSEIINKVFLDMDSDWGLILNIQEIDPHTLKQGLPIFVYFGDPYFKNLISSVKDSGITKFEVVGPTMPDIGKRIEAGTGKNLDLMLKYGRTIVNYPGMEGKILGLDAVKFSYPVEDIQIVKVIYYSNLGKIGVTFKNQGNIDSMFFSNLEYLDNTASDMHIHHILVGEEKTIPFSAKGIFEEDEKATLTTQYGFSIPFENQIKNNQGIPIFESEVYQNEHQENSNLEFVESDYDYKQDVLKLVFDNTNDYDIFLFSEIEIGKNTWTSKLYEIEAGREGSVIIRTPYTNEGEISEKFFNVTTYYGEIDTLNYRKNEVYVEKYKEEISAMIWIYIAIILLVGFLLFLLFKKRRKRK